MKIDDPESSEYRFSSIFIDFHRLSSIVIDFHRLLSIISIVSCNRLIMISDTFALRIGN